MPSAQRDALWMLTIRSLEGDQMLVSVPPHSTGGELKAVILDYIGGSLSPDAYRLIFRGAPLNDAQSIYDAGIRDRSLAHLIRHLFGS
jgi:hypothetical protein